MLFLLLNILTAGLALADDGSLPCENIQSAALSADLTKVRGPLQKVRVAKLVLQAKEQENAARLKCSGMKLESNEDKLAYAVADKTVGQGRTASMDLGTGRVLTDAAAVVDSVKEGHVSGVEDRASDRRHRRNIGFLANQGGATGVSGHGQTESVTEDAEARQAEAARKAAEVAEKAEEARQAKIRAMEAAGGS